MDGRYYDLLGIHIVDGGTIVMNISDLEQDGFTNQRVLVIPESLHTHCSNHPIIQSVYFTDIGYFPHALHHHRQREEGTAATIMICCIEGSGWVEIDSGNRQAVTPGQVAIIPAYTPHQYGADETIPWSIYWIHITGSHVPLFLGDKAWITGLSSNDLTRWIQLFEDTWEPLVLGVTIPKMLLCSQILRQMLAILHLNRTHLLHSDKQKYMQQAIQYMSERLHQQLSLSVLAKHVNVSKPYFSSLFKQQTGYSPIDFFLRMKIQKACNELDMSELSIKEIAASVGFRDPYYFSRQFSRIMSISPTAYRLQNKG